MTPSLQDAKWRDNQRAFELAVADLQGAAAAIGLELRQAEGDAGGWPLVRRAEVRSPRSCRVLASLDVGLGEGGTMVVQSSPGEARMFCRVQARDRAFYLRRIWSLLDAALPSPHRGRAQRLSATQAA